MPANDPAVGADNPFEPPQRLARNEAMATLLEVLRERQSLRNLARSEIETRPFASHQRELSVTSWATVKEIIEASRLPRSTVYRDLKVLARRGLVARRLIPWKDPRGPPRIAAYQIAPHLAPEPPVDPDVSRVWFEVRGQRFSMVNAWLPSGAHAFDGWTETTERELRQRVGPLKEFILFHIVCREAFRIGFVRVGGPYAKLRSRYRRFYVVTPIKGSKGWEVRAQDSPTRAAPADEIDEFLDLAEAGETIVLRSRGVAGRRRDPFDVKVPFSLDVADVGRAKATMRHRWKEEQ